ncbi:MAG: O-antigen ligase family protein [Actinomycetota bacterium]
MGLAVLALGVNLALPHRARLIGVALLLVPQFYLPGLPASIAVLWTLMTCLMGMTIRGRPSAASHLLLIAVLFVAATAASLLWALPVGIYLGVVSVTFGVVFTLWLREGIVLARNDASLVDTIAVWAAPGIAIQALLAIAFQISPGLESQFHHSRLAALLMGPLVVNLYTTAPNNVLDADKSGGLYVNGNAASLFGGVAGLLLCIAARRTHRHRWLYSVAVLSFAGSVATGSKTGVIVGSLCALFVLFLPHVLRSSGAIASLAITALFSVALSLTGLGEKVQTALSDSSFATRQMLWARAAQLLQDSPLLGAGFGGWTGQAVGKIGSRFELPPHNYLVSAWIYSGIVAAALALAFVLVTLAFGLRVSAEQTALADRRTAVMAVCATLWVFIHGIADNTPVYGDRQTMILFALAISYLYAMAPKGRMFPSASDRTDPSTSTASIAGRRPNGFGANRIRSNL